jgi:RNA polymerase sigma-70 factor (ECF subfamily)
MVPLGRAMLNHVLDAARCLCVTSRYRQFIPELSSADQCQCHRTVSSAASGLLHVSEREVDQALVERAQQGDRRAFDLLVLKYQQKVAGLISRYIRDSAEVMDVTQDAFLKAYRALPGFRGDSAFYTWIYRIAINTVKNHLVAQGRRPPGDDVDAELAEQMDLGARLRETATPERELLTDEIAATVQAALDALPEDLRTAIVLREFDGLSYEEIATAMDCPIGTVRSRIFRAREAIDKRLRPLLGG